MTSQRGLARQRRRPRTFSMPMYVCTLGLCMSKSTSATRLPALAKTLARLALKGLALGGATTRPKSHSRPLASRYCKFVRNALNARHRGALVGPHRNGVLGHLAEERDASDDREVHDFTQPDMLSMRSKKTERRTAVPGPAPRRPACKSAVLPCPAHQSGVPGRSMRRASG